MTLMHAINTHPTAWGAMIAWRGVGLFIGDEAFGDALRVNRQNIVLTLFLLPKHLTIITYDY